MSAGRTAFVFAGQGEEVPGMARAHLQSGGPVQALLTRASDTLDVDLARVIEVGGPELRRTELLQPALTAIGVGLALELGARGVQPDVVAGHSLGELSAVAVAGCIAPETAVALAVERGAAMARAAAGRPGGMLALTTAHEDELARALEAGRAAGALDVAARNTRTQWVLSGELSALQAVQARHAAVRLPVAGAWHSSLMTEAEASFREALARVDFEAPSRPLVTDAGTFWTDATSVAERLASQLTRPIDWVATMDALAGTDAETLYLLGPCRALRGLCRDHLGRRGRLCVVSGRRALHLEVAA